MWTPGDWNALFGFGTNILVNMLVLTGLLRFVLKMPDSLVFGRILPALGLMMCLSTFYYAWLAYKLAQKTGRSDVCALPSGVSVPHMFIVTFVIMLPITLKTGDPVKGWSAGLVWVFFQSFILMIGGFIAPYIRKITPRAALLGTLAGVSVTFISMRPALEMYMTPQIGLVCFAIILASWFGGVKYWKGMPAGLVAIAVGMIIAWGSNLFGLGLGGLSIKGVGDAFANFGFSVPLPAIGQVFSGFEFLGIILVTAIPFGIYDLVEAMDNVESAEAAGDEYPTTRVLTADGVISLIGCLMGNPFINAVYIGHPGWKAMGGRIGYSAATGIMVVVLSWFGIIAVLLALVPVVAISPILLYIGMLIGAQAFQTTPVKHAPAVVLALTPHLAAWAKLQIDTMLGATMAAAQTVGGLAADKVDAVKTAAIASLPQQGVIYHGLEVMGGGAILAGLVLGAIGVFVIERDFLKASAFALAGAVMTYFGFMHGEAVGIGGGLGVTPGVALAYAAMAAGLFALAKTSGSVAYSSHSEVPMGGAGRNARSAGLDWPRRPMAAQRVSGSAGTPFLPLDEGEQGAVAGGRRHDNAACAFHADRTQRFLRRGEIGRDHESCAAALGQAGQRHAGIALAELILGQEHEIGAVATRRHRDRAIRLVARLAVDHLGQMRGFLGRFGRDHQHLLQALGAIGMLHQFGNPDRLARLVLAGEDAHAARRFRRRPLKGAEFRRGHRSIRHRHRPLEIGGANGRIAARANFFGAFGRIHRRERDALDAFAALFKIRPRRSIMFCRRQHAEQFHIVRVEHDGVIARSHMRAVGAARRHGEAKPLVVFG